MPTTQICSETTYTLRFDTMECHPKMEGAFEDVPANCIVAGNPAKVVKTDIDKLPRYFEDR